MDIDIGLIAAIVREGFPDFYNQNIESEDIENSLARNAFRFIENHWKEYDGLPDKNTIQTETGIDLLSQPIEPLEFWCNAVKERKLYMALQSGLAPIIEKLAQTKPKDAFDGLQDLVQRLGQGTVSNNRPTPMFSDPEKIIEDYENSKKGLLGIETPWPMLDRLTKGWQESDLTLFAARPGSGKTFILLMCAVKAWQEGHTVLLSSTEMSHKSLKRRVSSLLFKLSYSKMRDGTLNSEDERSFRENVRRMASDDRFILFGDGFDVSVHSIEAAVIEKKPDIVFIDGLYLVKSSSRFRDQSEQFRNTLNDAKALGKRRSIPIICTTQMNRPGKGDTPSEGDLSRLAFSDNAAMVTDYVFFIRQTKEMKADKILELEPAKVREADFTKNICINWDFDNHNFSELSEEATKGEIDVLAPGDFEPIPDSIYQGTGAIPSDDPW